MEQSPNPKPEGKKLISTTALIQKKAKYGVELAEIGIEIAQARIDGENDLRKDLLLTAAELRRRIAVCNLRLSERRIAD
ncbi:MAG: hypothetical protein WCY09_08410 [Candidatus Omnitrophota bacterium]